ncbi:MAG TPA: TPM domain-containing protein [Ignavibacteriaceae bacterium]|nr:TPM domain-containing protein [Ignavibacteriaceae bacterium]
MQGLIYHFISDDEMLRISNRIKEVEKTTAGEICVAVKEHLHFLQRNKPIHALAEKEFVRLGVDKTRDKTGILIFVLLPKRQFYIMADQGINEKVPENTWDSIKDEMQKMFLTGEFSKGIIHGVQRVGNILSEHFPVKPDDMDEISNEIIID